MRGEDFQDPHPSQEEVPAVSRIVQYFYALGLEDEQQARRAAERIVRDVETRLPKNRKQEIEREATEQAMREVDAWLHELVWQCIPGRRSKEAAKLLLLPLRDILKRDPSAFLQRKSLSKAVLEMIRNQQEPILPPESGKRMAEQDIRHAAMRSSRYFMILARAFRALGTAKASYAVSRTGREGAVRTGGSYRIARVLLLLLSLVTTAIGSSVFASLIPVREGCFLYGVLVVLFSVLFLWISVSFWVAAFGFVECLRRYGAPEIPFKSGTLDPRTYEGVPKTAILMPVYNEDPVRVFSNLRAMLESLAELGTIGWFDTFVLSDTTDPSIWIEEEKRWAETRAALSPDCRIHYRRRYRNNARKSGNIADFCERWGGLYRYMIVLDADSLMEAETILEMVRRMEEDQGIGILQVPPVPVNQGSVFARMQEFAAGVYGRLFTAGYGIWAGMDGNYWGHNGIIRVAPFIEHCGLPRLSGHPPFGGEILSHDFVEAALMRRAGWKVQLAYDVGGSYEECPATLLDFAKRDQRWCQGNLQHLRLLFGRGFRMASRLHLWIGAMSYLASPLWLLFMLLSVACATLCDKTEGGGLSHRSILLFAFTTGLLFLPKVFGYLYLLTQRDRLAVHGGALRAGLSVLLEMVMSVFIAPIFMAFHVAFVVSSLFGRTVSWEPQRRDAAGITFAEALRAHGGHTAAGIISLYVIGWLTPELALWFLPVLSGLILSVPLSMILSSKAAAGGSQFLGLFQGAGETGTSRVLKKREQGLERIRGSRTLPRAALYTQIVLDPALNAVHVAILESNKRGQQNKSTRVKDAFQTAGLEGLQKLKPWEKIEILSRGSTMRRLHQKAWTDWPWEKLELVRRFRS